MDMTVDREIEEIIASFNSRADISARSPSALSSNSESKDPWNTLKIGLDGYFYEALFSSILAISDLVQKDEIDNNRERSKTFVIRVLLGMAARDRALSRSETQRIERDYAAHMPFSDVLWRELELFRSVFRLTDALGVRRPEFLQDERRTWGQLFLRKFARSIRTNAKVSMLLPSHFADQSLIKDKDLVGLEKGATKDSIVNYALRLADWDDSDIKLSHSASRDRSRLRKDIRQKLENYKISLKALEMYSNNLAALENNIEHNVFKDIERE